MTGRVCEVHGEWSATGTCRWCEPSEKYSLKSVDALTHQSFIDRTNRAIADLLGPPPEPLPDESTVAKAARDYFATRAGMRPLFSTRQRYSTPEGIASHNAFWEAKLAEEHAALRWERVARRYATKHGPWTMLDLAHLRQTWFDKVLAHSLKQLEKSLHPLLPVPDPEEPPP